MNSWQQWARQPRTAFMRKVLFQVHLWLGLITGLYIVMLSVTGSALVFLREMARTFRTWDPWWMEALWFTRNLHDELLLGREGRWWNGVFSAVVTVLCLTGAVVWWPGIRNWKRGMKVKWDAAWPRFNFDLHSALGFWFFGMMLIWAVSGIYLGIPDPFTAMSDFIAGDSDSLSESWFDVGLLWLTRLHFGRWRSHTLKAVWVIMGLVPTALFVTGAVMWWHRVVRRKNLLSENSRRSSSPAAPGASAVPSAPPALAARE